MLYGDDGDDQQEQAQPSLSSLSPSCLFLLWLMEDVQCDGEQQSVYRELLSPHFQPPRSTADYTGRRSGQHQPPASSTLTLAGLSSSQSVNWHKYHRLSHISSTPPHTPHPTSPHQLGLSVLLTLLIVLQTPDPSVLVSIWKFYILQDFRGSSPRLQN